MRLSIKHSLFLFLLTIPIGCLYSQSPYKHSFICTLGEEKYAISFRYRLELSPVGGGAAEPLRLKNGWITILEEDIYKKLNIVITNTGEEDIWINSPNDLAPPLKVVSRGEPLELSFRPKLAGGTIRVHSYPTVTEGEACETQGALSFSYKISEAAGTAPIAREEKPKGNKSPNKSNSNAVVKKQDKKKAENVAWETANEIQTRSAFQEYLRDFPGGRHVDQAKEEIFKRTPIELDNQVKEGPLYVLQFSNASKGLYLKRNYLTNKIIASTAQRVGQQLYKINLTVPSEKDVKVEICDSLKAENIPCRSITLSANPFVSSFTVGDNDSVQFSFAGGVPPYFLTFEQNTDTVELEEAIRESSFAVALTDLQQLLREGRYDYVKVLDSEDRMVYATPTNGMPIQLKPTLPFQKELLYLYGGIAIVVVIGIWALTSFIRRRRRQKQKELLEEINKKQQEELETANAMAEAEAFEQEGESQEINRENQEEAISISPAQAGPAKITIKRKTAGESQLSFEEHLRNGEYLDIRLSELWRDSALQKVHMAKDCIFELNNFLRQHNTAKIQELEGDIPEIGGMLLGLSKKMGSLFQVTVDKFVPIRSTKENVYRLEFDSDSIANDLVTFMDEHPGYLLVGWFHTHPGHGLFLSKPDLRIHHGHFRQPYQFAMEIDSLTENLDVTFFSWKSEVDEMNNTEDLISGRSWLSWIEIEKFTRRNN